MIFRCTNCKLSVTKNVILTRDEPPPTAEYEYEVDYPNQGFFAIGPPLTWEPDLYPGSLEFYVFNLEDIVNTYHKPGNQSGCCGLSGMSGINTICRNGHDIGIEFSDCWQAYRFLQVPPANVEQVEA